MTSNSQILRCSAPNLYQLGFEKFHAAIPQLPTYYEPQSACDKHQPLGENLERTFLTIRWQSAYSPFDRPPAQIPDRFLLSHRLPRTVYLPPAGPASRHKRLNRPVHGSFPVRNRQSAWLVVGGRGVRTSSARSKSLQDA